MIAAVRAVALQMLLPAAAVTVAWFYPLAAFPLYVLAVYIAWRSQGSSRRHTTAATASSTSSTTSSKP